MNWFCKPLWLTAIVENNTVALQIQYRHTILCTTMLEHIVLNNIIFNSALLDYHLNLFKTKSSFRVACFAIADDAASSIHQMALITQYKLWCLRNNMTCLMITKLSDLVENSSLSKNYPRLHADLIKQGQRYL